MLAPSNPASEILSFGSSFNNSSKIFAIGTHENKLDLNKDFEFFCYNLLISFFGNRHHVKSRARCRVALHCSMQCLCCQLDTLIDAHTLAIRSLQNTKRKHASRTVRSILWFLAYRSIRTNIEEVVSRVIAAADNETNNSRQHTGPSNIS